MGNKRIKIYRGLKDFVPIAVDFSQLEKEMEESNIKYEPGDGGLEAEKFQTKLELEELVVQILCNLEDDREKLIFMFQLLRDSGYQIDHGSLSKVIKLSRRQYMRVLEEVRFKINLFVIGYRRGLIGHKETK